MEYSWNTFHMEWSRLAGVGYRKIDILNAWNLDKFKEMLKRDLH